MNADWQRGLAESILEGKMACTMAEVETNTFHIEGNTELKKPTEVDKLQGNYSDEKTKIKRIRSTWFHLRKTHE